MIFRLLIFIGFIGASLLTAGLFGAVHDQISYTVSPEYYTRFKFIRFHLDNADMPERLRAAIVGIKASWWMGLPLGLLCGLAGFVQRTPRDMARALGWSLPLTLALVLAAALAGLAYGWFETRVIDFASYGRWYIPDGVEHLRAYLCAGYMHNAAYLGGGLAIPLNWVFQFFFRSSLPAPLSPASASG